MNRWRARGAAALLALWCVFAAVGCGGDADDDTPAAPASFFGVISQESVTEEDFARMRDGGVGVYRAFFQWNILEPTEGELDLSALDGVIAGAAAHGIEVLPFLYTSPPWVSKLDRYDCDDDCVLHAPASERSLDAWRDFVGALVKRYGPGGEFWREHPDLPAKPISAWEIWNEANSPNSYAPRPDVAAYERLLAASEEAIHAHDPEAEIVIGGMFGTPLGGEPPAITSPRFLAQLYRLEGSDPSFDVVGVHPYAAQASNVSEQVEAIHEVIERTGDDARLWVTEIGWSSEDGPEPLERGPEGQAENLTESFDYLLANREQLDLQGVIWYSWRDLEGAQICAWCERSGLFEEDGTTPKPAWSAFTSFTGGS